MTLTDIRAFLRAQPWAVEATVDNLGAPQAAVIGIAISDSLDIVFDTLTNSHKHVNLRANPDVALVVGWDAGRTVQLSGRCDQPTGTELTQLKDIYFRRFSDGRAREPLPNIAYWRVKLTVIRYSDFNVDPAAIFRWDRSEIKQWTRAQSFQ